MNTDVCLHNRMWTAAVVLLGLFFVKNTESTCKNAEAIPVAQMCRANSVSGTRVFIDTALADRTTITKGTACSCYAETQYGKKVEVYSEFNGIENSNCETTVEYTHETLDHITSIPCYTYFFPLFVQTFANISVSVKKKSGDGTADNCVELKLVSCGENEYQCDDGNCIPAGYKCNSMPDCDAGEDEQNCFPIVCTESMVPCDDNSMCLPASARCNNHMQCPDGSDEAAKYCDTKYQVIEPITGPAKTPLITVRCGESELVTTTTTSTTTPKPPTTTTTPAPTTTTTPSTTTTQSTTSTTTTPSTTTTTTPATTTTTTPTSTTTPPPPTTTTTPAPTTTTPPPTTTTQSTTTTTQSTTTTTPTTTTSTTTMPTIYPNTIPTTTTPPPTTTTNTPPTTTNHPPSTTTQSTTTTTTTTTLSSPTTTTPVPTTYKPFPSTITNTKTKPPTTSTDATPLPEAPSTDTGGGRLSDNDETVIGVTVTVGVCLIALLVIGIIVWRRSDRQQGRGQHDFTPEKQITAQQGWTENDVQVNSVRVMNAQTDITPDEDYMLHQ